MTHEHEQHICEEDGCLSPETQEYTWPVAEPGTPDTVWYCAIHAVDAGFCYGCHHFCAGTEDYDFSPVQGYCGQCLDELRYETGEYDDDENDDTWDYYPHSWHDPDVDSDDEDSTHTYIGEDREDLG